MNTSPWRNDAPPLDYAPDEPESPRQATLGAVFFAGAILGLFIGLIL